MLQPKEIWSCDEKGSEMVQIGSVARWTILIDSILWEILSRKLSSNNTPPPGPEDLGISSDWTYL